MEFYKKDLERWEWIVLEYETKGTGTIQAIIVNLLNIVDIEYNNWNTLTVEFTHKINRY